MQIYLTNPFLCGRIRVDVDVRLLRRIAVLKEYLIMKTSKNKNKRLEIRISEDDLKLLKIASYCIGQTPSQMLRMFIDSTINGLKIKVRQGEIKLEDFEAILND